MHLHLFHEDEIVLTYDISQTPNHHLIHTEMGLGLYSRSINADGLVTDKIELSLRDIEVLESVVNDYFFVIGRIKLLSERLFKGVNEENLSKKINQYNRDVNESVERADKRVEILRRCDDLDRIITSIIAYAKDHPEKDYFVFIGERSDLDSTYQ
ncbi:hypothetical protein [Alicyclobacillus fodiniaquatilis]|uniref:Uncharacterized protein n=1 Tax=Alicyclobacillus fodiniaquatilis TaxID=1661150 RepID=A0ABW4JIK5_9BACL